MNFKLRSLVASTLTSTFLLGFTGAALADSTDDIVNALMAKGVLTEEEGALLLKGRTGEKEAADKKKESAVTAKYKDGIVLETVTVKIAWQSMVVCMQITVALTTMKMTMVLQY